MRRAVVTGRLALGAGLLVAALATRAVAGPQAAQSGQAAVAAVAAKTAQAGQTGQAARSTKAGPPARPGPASSADASRFDRCFLLAGERYGVSPLLLKAIARQESGLNPAAINRNANGSTDVGLMQINSSWLPVLARHGVKASDLHVPCANILVGAWILGGNFRAMGRNADALGAYNARDPVKRQTYARQVLRHYVALRHSVALGAEPGTPDSVAQVR